MAVVLFPESFSCGDTPPDNGEGWEICGEIYKTNPKNLLEPQIFDMVTLWRAYQGGMGSGILPDGGGLLDQANIMIEAFNIMSYAETRLKGQG